MPRPVHPVYHTVPACRSLPQLLGLLPKPARPYPGYLSGCSLCSRRLYGCFYRRQRQVKRARAPLFCQVRQKHNTKTTWNSFLPRVLHFFKISESCCLRKHNDERQLVTPRSVYPHIPNSPPALSRRSTPVHTPGSTSYLVLVACSSGPYCNPNGGGG